MTPKFDDCFSCANRGRRICRSCDVGEYFTEEEVADTVDRFNRNHDSVSDDDITKPLSFDPDRFADELIEDDDAEEV